MGKEQFEEVVLYANLCLKRWQALGKPVDDRDQIKSMLLSWLHKLYTRHYQMYGNWRERKALSKKIGTSIIYEVSHTDGIHISNLIVQDGIRGVTLDFPLLDYDELNKRATALTQYNVALRDIESVKFYEIEQIKFT